MSKNNNRFGNLERFANASHTPKDVILNYPIVTTIGITEITIENYRGILEFDHTLIRVSSKTGQIKIHGESLNIQYYTNEEMKITGKVKLIEYC
ncbi:MAG: YabP/YqfC family sporulation protein [Eubacteriales bacterium]